MEREEAIKWLKQLNTKPYSDFPYKPMNEALDMASKVLEQEPRTGHWIGRGISEGTIKIIHEYQCSECHEMYPYDEDVLDRYNFCPNCGADMRGDKE